MDRGGQGRARVSRRAFIGGGLAAGAAVAWSPAFRVDRASAAATCAAPPAFPAGIELYQQAFSNWALEIVVDDLWTCAPRTPADIVTIANWAIGSGYRLRARGMMHGWSPLTVTPGSGCGESVVLLDTTEHLTDVQVVSTAPGLVRAQAGATMDEVLGALERSGLGMTATPAPGDITIGGVLAVGAHGTAIQAAGEEPLAGHTYGSVSNLLVSLTAVVWDPEQHAYVLRRFERSDPDAAVLNVNLGRTILTEVELRVGDNVNLRCQSFVDIPATEMFAAPGSAGRTIESAVASAGRVEAIWYPFTDNPWLKIWSVSPEKPASSRLVNQPYNYVFSDELPVEVSDLATKIVEGDVALAPAFGAAQYAVTAAGLPGTDASDLWGPSKNLLLYVLPSTIRATANGYAVLCRQADIQRVVHEFATFYPTLVERYRQRGSYPINMPVEIRATGLDQPTAVGIPGAQTAMLAALHPRPDRPEWNVAVWIDVLTLTGTPDSEPFYADLEQWFFSNYGTYACVHPEWSKGWAYTDQAAWSNPDVLSTTIPGEYDSGRPRSEGWHAALAALDRLDPHRLFTNAFIDRLMPSTAQTSRKTTAR